MINYNYKVLLWYVFKFKSHEIPHKPAYRPDQLLTIRNTHILMNAVERSMTQTHKVRFTVLSRPMSQRQVLHKKLTKNWGSSRLLNPDRDHVVSGIRRDNTEMINVLKLIVFGRPAFEMDPDNSYQHPNIFSIPPQKTIIKQCFLLGVGGSWKSRDCVHSIKPPAL